MTLRCGPGADVGRRGGLQRRRPARPGRRRTTSRRPSRCCINRTFAPRVATPTFTPAGGTYVGPVAVALSDDDAGRDDSLHDRRQHADPGLAASTRARSSSRADHDRRDRRGQRDDRQRGPRRLRTIRAGRSTRLQRAGGTYTSHGHGDAEHATPRRDDPLHDRRQHADDRVGRLHRSDRVTQTTTIRAIAAASGMARQRRGQRNLHDPAAAVHAGLQPRRAAPTLLRTVDDHDGDAAARRSTTRPTAARRRPRHTVYTAPIAVTQTRTIRRHGDGQRHDQQ